MCETFSVPSARITKCVAFQDNSSRVVTCMWDGGIRVWEVLKRRTLVTVPQAHAQKIIDCDVSNNCLWIASASQDATCKLWSSDADVCLGKIIHLPYAVTCCRFSPTDDYLMTGDAAGEVRMFSLPHGTFCHKLSGHSSAVSEIRFLNTSPEVCMSCASEIKFWSLNKEKPLRSYPLSCPSSRKVALLTSNLIVIADNGGRLYVLSALTRVSHDT
ncbi:unnamed protein product [Soboliphyme baturini]|uniref:WD_REPEATS_REGION domain-containing protein n=1 Tax=Soboliphyme baturini TaxID=241478 RepID=A0A183IQY2_9BILA|nr:unnamed protein product [Soboliphyme baturini]